MLFFRRAGSFSLLVGFLFVLVAGWFFFSGIGFAALYCPPCDCHYELSTAGVPHANHLSLVSLHRFGGSPGIIYKRMAKTSTRKTAFLNFS